jgi:hypothetical protein
MPHVSIRIGKPLPQSMAQLPLARTEFQAHLAGLQRPMALQSAGAAGAGTVPLHVQQGKAAAQLGRGTLHRHRRRRLNGLGGVYPLWS